MLLPVSSYLDINTSHPLRSTVADYKRDYSTVRIANNEARGVVGEPISIMRSVRDFISLSSIFSCKLHVASSISMIQKVCSCCYFLNAVLLT